MPLIGEAEHVDCRWCHKPVVWAYDVGAGKRIPIDPQIVADGQLVQVLRPGRSTPGVRFLHGDEKISRQGARYRTHMSSCAERDAALTALEARRAGVGS